MSKFKEISPHFYYNKVGLYNKGSIVNSTKHIISDGSRIIIWIHKFKSIFLPQLLINHDPDDLFNFPVFGRP